MRKSTVFLSFTGINAALFAIMLAHAAMSQDAARALEERRAEMVRELMLTDLCIFTEARYTRNPSMADFHAPFQDHPGALEHFPSGSLVSPPSPGAYPPVPARLHERPR
jgi:hypothetical protein